LENCRHGALCCGFPACGVGLLAYGIGIIEVTRMEILQQGEER